MSNAIKPDVTPEGATRQATGFVPTRRLEALTDAVFAFAMTLLVINIELPDKFDPKTTQAFLQGLARLSDTFIAYLITFLVLVAFWSGRAQQQCAAYNRGKGQPAWLLRRNSEEATQVYCGSG